MARSRGPAPDTNTGALLLQAHLRLAARINREVIGRGFEGRPAHAAVFIHMDLDGIRLTQLAEKAQMTPQAMGELIDDLVGLGYLERVPDPTDRRAKLIVFTARGRTALRWGLDAVAGVEADLAKTLGRRRLAELHAALEEIVAGSV